MSSGSLYRSGESFEPAEGADWPPEIAFLAAAGVDPRIARRGAGGRDWRRRRRDPDRRGDGRRGLLLSRPRPPAPAPISNAPLRSRRDFDYRAALRASVARRSALVGFDWLMAPRGAQVRGFLALVAFGGTSRVAIRDAKNLFRARSREGPALAFRRRQLRPLARRFPSQRQCAAIALEQSFRRHPSASP